MNNFKHFSEFKGRYKYISSKIQNEMISSCGNSILNKIVQDFIQPNAFLYLLAHKTLTFQ